MRFLLLSLLSLAGLCLPARAQADLLGGIVGSDDGKPYHVTLSADQAAIAPGGEFNLVFTFELKPTWHAYWMNPGSPTGLPFTAKWKLPPGFTTGTLEHPDPQRIKIGNQEAFYGYEGSFPVAVHVKVPSDLKPGSKAALAVDLRWLSCDHENCVPSDASLSLELPVAATATPDAAVAKELAAFRAARGQLPGEAWKISGQRSGENVVLTLTPGPGAVAELKGARYLSSDPTVFAEPDQKLAKNPDGSYSLTAPLSEDGKEKFNGISGLLFADSGWTTGKPAKFIAIPQGLEAATVEPPLSLALVFAALLGGLILNIMPCVFPVIGIKVLGIVEQAGSSRKKVLAHGLTFTAGVLVTFWVLAGLLIFLKSGGEKVGWGFQMQNPYFVYFMTVFVLVFALNLSGLFEIGQSLTGVGQEAQSQSGLKGSFMSGLFATVVATPCSAPFLGAALTAATTMGTVNSFLMFTLIGLGLSAPYLLLGLFPKMIDLLPRPGAWMETFKKLMAFPLYATAAYLIWVLGGLTEPLSQLFGMVSLCFIALGAFVYGHWCAPHMPAASRRKGLAATAILAGLALFIGWPEKPGNLWEHWTKATEQEQRAEHAVYVDFTARWCATCQSNKAFAYSAEVKRVAKQKGIVFLKADWTNYDPEITKELSRLGESAIPVNVLYVPGRDKPFVFGKLLTPGALLEQFNKLPDAREEAGK